MIPLLEVKKLTKHFILQNGVLKAVEDVSFKIFPGKTLGLVGESGSGKSTIGQMLVRLTKPTSGQILYEGKDIFTLSKKESKDFRRKVQIIFQDPYSSLNPRMDVEKILLEPLQIHNICPKEKRKEKIEELLQLVGLDGDFLRRYPHQLSGGQRQRIAIARALAVSPECIVCDEPTSSLDVSIQAQIVHLLKELQEKIKLSYLFISHNLPVIHYLSEQIAVMYLGHIVEIGPREKIYNSPFHPYTKALLSSVFIPDPKANKEKPKLSLFGENPSPMHPPKGCVYSTRCSHATEICHSMRPEMKELSTGHFVSCHYSNPIEVNHVT